MRRTLRGNWAAGAGRLRFTTVSPEVACTSYLVWGEPVTVNSKQIALVVVLPMLWLFVGAGIWMNLSSWWIGLHAKEGERVPSGVLFVFGILGAFLAYITVGLITKYLDVSVPWPWLWVALPLFLDVYCLGGFVLMLFGFARREDADGPG